MTIEDVREELISILTEIEITGGSMVTSIYKDELKMAIDTISKYQKIQQIVEDRYGKPIFKFMDAIVKVVEDGKTD